MSSRLAFLAKPALSLLSLCLTVAVLEASLRLYHKWRYDVPLWPGPAELSRTIERGQGNRLSSIVLDDVLGWRSTPGYTFQGARRNGDGTSYNVSLSFDDRGFRVFDHPGGQRPKIFVLGDSFTQAVEVSDDKTYYSLLRETLNAEMFVYGAGGYGTLQEYMILDEYVDQIRPDVLLWQYCSNDFINNDPQLERGSLFSNNGLRRPYWIDGQVQYLLPKADPAGIRTFTVSRTRLGYWMLSRWDLLQPALFGGSVKGVEYEVERLGFQHPGFRRAVEVTDALMAKVRGRAGPIPIVAFSCDDRWPYSDALRDISARNGVAFVEAVGRSVDEADEQGAMVKVQDGHWNEAGHRMVADAITSYLRAAGLVRQ